MKEKDETNTTEKENFSHNPSQMNRGNNQLGSFHSSIEEQNLDIRTWLIIRHFPGCLYPFHSIEDE